MNSVISLGSRIMVRNRISEIKTMILNTRYKGAMDQRGKMQRRTSLKKKVPF